MKYLLIVLALLLCSCKEIIFTEKEKINRSCKEVDGYTFCKMTINNLREESTCFRNYGESSFQVECEFFDAL